MSDVIEEVKKQTWLNSLKSSLTKKKSELIEVTNTEYVRLKIVPDSSLRNWRTEDIARSIAEQFRLPIDRIIRDGLKIKGYRLQERAAFEMKFVNGNVNFYLHVPKNLSPLLIRRMQSVWDKATIEIDSESVPFDVEKTTIFESVYRKHDMYSLHTNAKDNLPLGSLLEAGRLLSENEKASVFTYMDPMHQISWQYELSEAWNKLRSGKVPRKWNASAREVLKGVATAITAVLSEVITGLSDIVSSSGKEANLYANKPSDPEALKYTIDNLTESTKGKRGKQALKTYIWTMVESDDEGRANLIGRTLASSFNDLAGDNELEAYEIKSKKRVEVVMKTYETKLPPTSPMKHSKMSTAEVGKFIQLPGLELQEQYAEIERIETKQVEVTDKNLTKENGILIGDITYKGKSQTVYQPTHDQDELCLPHIGIGGMGQGKTKGYLANYLLEATLKGYGGLSIDPAKGEIGDQLEHAVKVGVLAPDKFVRRNLGVTPFALDFCEAMYDDRARARLANIVINFFGVAEETTGQTERFLRAAVLGMKTGRISEIMRIFENEAYLDETIERLTEANDEFNLSTLIEYKSYQPGMRRKILSPIYNRLNDIMGDPFLAECMRSDDSLDFVEILSQKKAFVFDVLASDLDKPAIDIIVSLLSLKIDLAMHMRKKVKGEEHPFFVLIDEPHQFAKSTRVWEYAVVESRKYRVCYIWTFHFWDQIPKQLQKAIRNALPHYHLYPTTTETFQSLRNEIYPFTVEEALKVKRWHAINIIRTGGENAVPFVAKMAAPPMERFKEKNKQKIS